MQEQIESETFTITRIGWDSFGIIYVEWSGGGYYWWEEMIHGY